MDRSPERSFEESPQLIVGVNVYRNGGTDGEMYVCTECLVVGLRHARKLLDEMLAAHTD
jgi:hypothetical protein